jgi:diazepam-binding inhibitor (GABA receptor modulating acyl-CoA-binding protein)
MSQKSLEEKFNELCKIIQSLPPDGPFQLGNDDKLIFYGLFKQANEGDIKTEQPYFFQVVERAKWDAW